jgi:hypothetical protein
MWFPKYRTKVMGAIQAEAQRGVKFIELAAIKGGPVTQVRHFFRRFFTLMFVLLGSNTYTNLP